MTTAVLFQAKTASLVRLGVDSMLNAPPPRTNDSITYIEAEICRDEFGIMHE